MGNEADGGGGRRFLGIAFDSKISVGTVLVLVVNIVGGSFVAGVVWNSVSVTPGQIAELKITVDKRFDLIADKLNLMGVQTAAITDLSSRQHELAAHQTETDGRIVQLRVDMSAMQAEVGNIKGATSACLPGDRRPECPRR